MEEGPCYTLRAPSCMWRRFQSTRRSRSGDDEGLGFGCHGIHQVPHVGSKRRSRDHDRQQAAQGTTESRKKARWLFTDEEEDVLRSFLAQYTADDMARFNEDMAHTDKLLDEAAAKLAEGVVPDLLLLPRSPSLLELEEEEEDSDEGGGGQRASGCGSDTTIEMFRAFTRTRFHPISERFLCDPGMFDEDVAQEIREEDRFISKVYAWAKERAAEAVDEYDAKGRRSNAGSTQSM